MVPSLHYVGRFAPSPTGALHFGSVIAALASYLCAKSVDGEWLLRIDDIDPPREQPGAVDAILRTLEKLGLVWDREVLYQSRRRNEHQAVCAELLARRYAYRCGCSRKVIGDRPYPGTCRGLNLASAPTHAVRVQISQESVTVVDQLQGSFTQDLSATSGDFVIWRVEDLPSYHLATVLDDEFMGVTEIVRGADLLESTPRQYFLQMLLGLAHPTYLHLPIALDPAGQKLSKQAVAEAIEELPASDVLGRALAFLGHPIPPGLSKEPVTELLAWARIAWQRAKIPAIHAAPISGG
ncbi:MAG: tRNA glutamyl-Q(34) synthetase GluQRS [Gammaproteobacteria bacterium]|nr:tRNA glutamyl-Q(34) synthetase GluQRS [Gammaproteobacteria bacterium]